jgi:hypothetical protein
VNLIIGGDDLLYCVLDHLRYSSVEIGREEEGLG